MTPEDGGAGGSANGVSGSLPSRFDELRELGHSLTHRGEFEEALGVYREAHQVALRMRDRDKLDVAQLNVATVLIQMGETRRGEEGLREILLRTSCARTAFSAAYNLASSLRKRGRHERAMTYAQRAMDQARRMSEAGLVASCHNLIGNILLTRSFLDEALAEYETALGMRQALPDSSLYSIAILRENIGYCLLLKERLSEGLEQIHQALELAEEVGDRRCRTECLQDLCYGYLLVGRHAKAVSMGEQALTEAVACGYGDITENCHYLLGELGSRTGDLERRDLHFEELQQMHPELPFLKDFLCSVDVTSIITLRR